MSRVTSQQQVRNRFFGKIAKNSTSEHSACWEWIGCKNRDGYGQFRINGETVSAHRYILLLEGIDIPSGMCVCHTCDNPGCVNPDHLFLATHAENMRDRDIKQRGTLGERNSNAKLCKTDVLLIRALDCSYHEIAAFFDISVQNIYAIKQRKSWKHV